jgi:DNA-binding response OmpR family regulator
MNEKILVVDDDDLVRSGLAMNVERAGFEVYSAATIEQAQLLLDQHSADLVLCDLVLGDDNGMDLLRHVQAHKPDTAVVIITGHGTVRNALEALKGGASDYIQKPSDPEEVIHRIRMVLDSIKLRRSLMEERRHTEERKKILHDQLNRSERMASLGTLAEGAAHDLREILQPVENTAGEMLKKIEPGHEHVVKLQELDEAMRKASAVIRDLEAIGKSNTLNKTNLQINQVISDYLKSREYHQISYLSPKVKIETVFDPDLPLVLGSSHHLRQLIANLITNALESMIGGGILRIRTASKTLEAAAGRFGSRSPGDYVEIVFADTAPQLSEDDVERVFEPFYVRRRMGRRLLSGLGMTLVYRVVEDHRGFVDLRSGEAIGNIFSVYFPVSRESDTAILELRPDYTGSERILLVDDSEPQRTAASAMLRELGYEVSMAENGYAAVELVKARLADKPGKRPYDLMVIDLVLGDAFDGVETYKNVLELYPAQRAVLASGFADITRIVEARKLGISRCFQKPYTVETLGKNIRLALDES